MNGVGLPLLAVVAGVVSITSPCCLPLIPSYVSYVSSLPVGELPAADGRRMALHASLLFVGGFTIVFTALGLTASVVGSVLLAHLPLLTRIAGLVIVAMGLSTLGVIPRTWLQRERRLDLHRLPRGRLGALPLGMAFAAGWTPCIGPVLATILALAASSGSAVAGGVLLALYSAGLGVPFVAIALGYHRLGGSLGWVRRHGRGIERAGGLLLVVVGVGYLSGQWLQLFRPLQRWFARFGWPPV